MPTFLLNQRIYEILYQLIKNSKIRLSELANKTKLKEHQVRYIIKKLKKYGVIRYMPRIRLEDYPIGFAIITRETPSLSKLTKNLLTFADGLLMQGFVSKLKDLAELKDKTSGEVIILIEEVIENFLLKEEYR